MTIICALHDAGIGTWIASDSLVCAGDTFVGHTKKWIMGDGCAVGVCGSNAINSIITEHAKELKADWSGIAFFRWLKPLLIDHGFKPKAEEGQTPWYDASYLIATPTGIISIDSAGGGISYGHGQYASRGSGAYHADGAAWALAREQACFERIVTDSVQAAIAHGNGCGGNVFVDCLKP